MYKPHGTQLPLALSGIPPFPGVALQVLRVASNEYARLRELSDLIASDPVFASDVLRMANSSLFGMRAEVESILHATLLLGLERVKAVVLTTAMRNYLGSSLDAPWMRNCWRHSLACATIAEELASGTAVEQDVAYTAGLIHDIGRLALAVAYTNEYGDFLMTAGDQTSDLLEREHEQFGVDHCEAGSALASWWDLPRSLVRVISLHHEPATGGEFDVLAAVRLSCVTADALGFESVHPFRPRTYPELLAELDHRERSRLPNEPVELAFRVASKINSIELS